MACGNRLISPKLRAGQELDAVLILKVYKSKALYIRPSKPILDDITGYSSEDNNGEENTGPARQLRSSLRKDGHLYASSDSFTSPTTASPECTSVVETLTETPVFTCQSSMSLNHSSTSVSSSSRQLPVSSLESSPSTSQLSTSSTSDDPTLVLTCQSSSSHYRSGTPASHCSALPSTSTHGQLSNYDNYLSVMAALSDVSSDDEELNQAILASLQSERRTTESSVPVRDILQALSTKINHQKKCKFNINRSTVLDGAIRGFKRGTYDPCHTISVRFSDDMGVPEEAVDLGGPRREFLRLLMEALPQSSMFEGEEGKMNLALDSTGI
ncbi:uncharacterized protein LOC127535907 [Acanthochromis polyacanthus]|uniref:uncharacterized protein LOC127535907 n=1 Tax=Acanthochromis polyacanthus TaxID=80966 RepID=UPI002233FD67|nr:uncharacterized protein LOC127535907 [Acanthochromis polyacanthus]